MSFSSQLDRIEAKIDLTITKLEVIQNTINIIQSGAVELKSITTTSFAHLWERLDFIDTAVSHTDASDIPSYVLPPTDVDLQPYLISAIDKIRAASKDSQVSLILDPSEWLAIQRAIRIS